MLCYARRLSRAKCYAIGAALSLAGSVAAAQLLHVRSDLHALVYPAMAVLGALRASKPFG